MLWWLAQNTMAAGLLALLVLAICRLRRFSPAVRHVLWLLVLVKLLTPPLIAWPWPVPDLWPAEAAATRGEPALDAEEGAAVVDPHDAALGMLEQVVLELSAEKAGLEALAADRVPDMQAGVASEESSVAAGLTTHHSPLTTHRSPLTTITWPAWAAQSALYSWLAGTGVMVLVQWRRIERFRRRLARAFPGPRWLLRLIRYLGGRLQVPPPRPVIVPGSGSPLLWSLGRPQLVWPADLLDRLPAASRRSVVAHELAHLKRRDHWVGWMLLVAECVWWWNPLFWWVRRQVRHNAELACDAWVVSTLPGDRRAYAEALIDVSQWVSTAALPVPALGMGPGPRQAFTERLTMIMRDATPCRVPRYGLLAVGLLALLVIPGWSLAQKTGAEKTEVKKLITLPPTEGDKLEVILLADDVAKSVKEATTLVGRLVVADEEQQAPATKASDARDQKLEALEAKLRALLEEIRAMRGAPPTAGKPVEIRYRTVPALPGAQRPMAVEVQVQPPPAPKKVEVKTRVIEVPEVYVETVPGTSRNRTVTTYQAVPAPGKAGTVYQVEGAVHAPDVTAAIKKAIGALQAAGKKAEAEELTRALETMQRHAPQRIYINTPQSNAPLTAPQPANVIPARPSEPAVVRPPASATGGASARQPIRAITTVTEPGQPATVTGVIRAREPVRPTITVAEPGQPATATGVISARQPVRASTTVVEPKLASYYSALRRQPGEVLLSRATYKLDNQAKAEALGAFLKDNIKASVMEIKVDGDSLTITTTPETQKAIGQLMGLTKGDGKTKTSALPEVRQFEDVRFLSDVFENKPEAAPTARPAANKEPKKP